MINTTVKALVDAGIIYEPMDGNHGELHPVAKDYVATGIPFIMAADLEYGSVNYTTCKYITEETAKTLRKGFAKEGDILLTHKATIGRTARLQLPNTPFAVLTPQVTYYRVKNETVLDPYYLKLYFDSPSFQYIIKKRAGAGSTRAYIGITKQGDLPVSYPDIKTQKDIVSVLKPIDDKIAQNSRICRELEQMAKMIYDYWFTQFDFPDADGNPYCSSGGAMVWNEQIKRKIPAGWDVGNLYAIANPINGLACQKYRPKETEEALPVVKIKEMHEGITEDTELVSINIPAKHKIFDGDILFSWSATLEVMYWFGGAAGLNQHIFKVVPINGFSKEYVYHQFSGYVINFVKMAEARKTTMGHITTEHLEQSRIVLPPDDIVQEFSKIVSPIHERIGHCQKENRELIKLRDWLLPMLMNGQATVEQEKVIE